jgi:cytochrome c oxidase subunit II
VEQHTSAADRRFCDAKISGCAPDRRYKREPMKKLTRLAMLVASITVSTALPATLVRAQEPQRIEITAKRFTYEPGEITLKKGQPVVLVLKSVDVTHGLRVRELNVDVKIPAGGALEVQLTPKKTGNFVAHCSVFCGAGHGSMALKLHVVE